MPIRRENSPKWAIFRKIHRREIFQKGGIRGAHKRAPIRDDEMIVDWTNSRGNERDSRHALTLPRDREYLRAAFCI